MLKEKDSMRSSKNTRSKARLLSNRLPDTDEEAESTVKKCLNGEIEGKEVLSGG